MKNRLSPPKAGGWVAYLFNLDRSLSRYLKIMLPTLVLN